MIGITGATGQLGQLVITALRNHVPAPEIVALARRPEALADLEKSGITVRQADYTDAASLDAAFTDIDRLLLISSSEIGQRTPQHKAVIDAAVKAGVEQVVYTSILHADTSPLGLAQEHAETEVYLATSGLKNTILRNGWYSENYAMALPQAVEMGKLFGAAQDGRFSTATRADYAEAAARVLAQGAVHAGKVYELGGNEAFTLSELADFVADASGKPVTYQDMPPLAYAEVLKGAGLPEPFAELLANSDAGAAKGGLFTDSGDLARLIERPTTPMRETVQNLLA